MKIFGKYLGERTWWDEVFQQKLLQKATLCCRETYVIYLEKHIAWYSL